MKKRTISKLKSLFSSKKGKRQQEQQNSAKSSRSVSPDSGPASPAESENFHPIQRTPPPSRVGPPPSPPVPTTPVVPVAPEPPGPLSLLPCQVCGRTFVQQSLAKHVKICEKMTVKKRKTFDSSRQRREGTDLEQYLPKNFGLPENSPFLEKSSPQVVKATPKPKPQSVRSAIMKPTADLQKCPHCNRAFGLRAFERHVEWCADKAKILPAAPAQPPPHIADAKQRLNARTQYKAPPVRGRRSSQSRDKSSLSRSTSVESTRGVSPAPPREYGDYRHGRTRASESLSSNDCIDDSPHIPVIRNSRAPQNKSSGDANVKARQARLARDISNSRLQEQTKSLSIQTSTAPGPSKVSKNDKIRLDAKKRHQLKKLDEISNKYKERETIRENLKINSRNKMNVITGSQIPLAKYHKITETKTSSNNVERKKYLRVATNTKRIRDIKCEIKDMDKESTMSIDSLDENDVNKNKNSAKNAQMLCPCVPCFIHKNNEPIPNMGKKKTNMVKESNKEPTNSNAPPMTQVLFKNMKFISGKEKKTIIKSKQKHENNKAIINTEVKVLCNSKENQKIKCKVRLDPQIKGDLLIETNCAFSHHNANDLNKENTLIETNNYENINCLDSRHGSGETYTKFTENPADLEEFFIITDQMIHKQQQDQLNNNITNFEKDIDKLHTPQTDSLETLNTESLSDFFITKNQFSNALEDLKKGFKDVMLGVNTGSLPPISKEPDHNIPMAQNEKDTISIKNMDMEHVFEFKHQKSMSKRSTDDNTFDIKLPSINNTNKNIKHSGNKKKAYTRKIKMLSLQKRTSKNYQTFIINNEDTNESNDEAPPLKLPRIENSRIDDNYDPFASAARQMKELMSTDMSVPKKANNNKKGSTNTLPNLKQAKDKLSLSHPRPDNTKMMKDTINKTYQKTPTLQRMKSFGSSNIDNNNSFGGRCSSFRVNRNDKKPSQNLNSTFTKSSKENIISADKTYFNRNSSMNRSFSSYSSSSYSTPKLKDKIPKLSQSMHHGFQRNTIKQPLKLDKINKNEEKSDPVTLGSIFSYDNGSSMTDSNYIDPRLINENDNLPINVNTILNNPDIISSMESLLTTENLPAKFESFSAARNNHDNSMSQSLTNTDEKNNNINNIISPTISDLSSRYDKIISSLEQSVTSKASARDDDSLCEDFDLEEFMTSFDEEVNKQKIESKRTYSSTTRIVAHSEICDNGRKSDTKVVNSPKIVNGRNGMIPVNKSTSLVFSSNIAGEKFFPSSVKRSTSLLDSIQKKTKNTETTKSRQSVDKLEDDIMQSLKEFDKFYESQKNDSGQLNKEMSSSNKRLHHDTIKRDVRKKNEPKAKPNKASNGNCTPNGKASNDSAYSSLNRISPSKLSLCKETNGVASLDRIPAGSDTSSSHKDDLQSMSSDEFLAMERTAELTVTEQSDMFKDQETKHNDNNTRESSRELASPSWRPRKENLSSSGSESSLYRTTKESSPALRLSRFCHECGSKFPVDTAKFCIECGVKRLVV